MSSLSAIGYNIQDFLYQGTIGLFYKNKQIEKEIEREESNENPSDPPPASSADLVLNVADDDYKLPSVVVVGLQSSGKSTLLENITKVPIFPRSAGGICTKFPVKVVLRGKRSKKMYYCYVSASRLLQESYLTPPLSPLSR